MDIKAYYLESKNLRLKYDLRKPRANHNRCNGRGYIGTRQVKGQTVPYLCDCVLKPLTPEASLKRITDIIEESKAAEAKEVK